MLVVLRRLPNRQPFVVECAQRASVSKFLREILRSLTTSFPTPHLLHNPFVNYTQKVAVRLSSHHLFRILFLPQDKLQLNGLFSIFNDHLCVGSSENLSALFCLEWCLSLGWLKSWNLRIDDLILRVCYYYLNAILFLVCLLQIWNVVPRLFW